jgi:all-trans-retinol dehydrogenase (NAD+)
MNLRNKTAIITGGAMGIGLATAKRLIKEDCIVTLWDINEAALKEAKQELEKINGRVFIHICDVTDKNRINELAKTAYDEMGDVDILINNAGYVKGGEILEQPVEIWEATIDINLTALVYTIQAFLPKMYENDRGHIVNISSAAGMLGDPGLSVYCATKWAVWGLTESLRFEAFNNKKFGVKYSSIHPSFLAKGLFAGAKLGPLGNLIVPLVKDHDVIAKAIVESALKKGSYSPKRPRTLNLVLRLRAALPDKLFQKVLVVMGVTKSMKTWKGRTTDNKEEK